MFQKIKHLPNIKRHLQIVFSLNAGKYGPEKTLYLDTFHAVFVMQRKMQTKCSLCPKEFKFKFLVKKRKNQHASQAAKICSSCHLSFKRIDHFESQKTTCVVLDSGADEQFVRSFSCLSPTPSNNKTKTIIIHLTPFYSDTQDSII